MAKQFTYRVTTPRFHGGVLYKPGDREIIVSDEEITKGVVLLSSEKAVNAVKKQAAKTDQKKNQVAEQLHELSSVKGLSPAPDFSGAGKKASNVVTL